MPSLKRDRLLSDLERERLTKREALDRHTRTTNDVRVKRKLASWFKVTDDVLRILDDLPRDQIRDITTDQDVYILFNIINDLLAIRKFYPIEGEVDKSDDWQIVIDENTKRPAENSDIMRSSMLGYYLDNLNSFHGDNNPIDEIEFLEKLDKSAKYQDRVKDEDRKAIKRLNQAREDYYIEIGYAPEETNEAPK